MSDYEGPRRHNSIRLPKFDYSRAGAYYVTVCVQDKKILLGRVINGEIQLDEFGKLVEDSWSWLENHYSYIELDEWIVMPNHFHGIIVYHEIRWGGWLTAC